MPVSFFNPYFGRGEAELLTLFKAAGDRIAASGGISSASTGDVSVTFSSGRSPFAEQKLIWAALHQIDPQRYGRIPNSTVAKLRSHE